MVDQPLNAMDKLKLTFFIIVSLLTFFPALGFIPSILIIKGCIVSKRRQDFSYLGVAIKKAQQFLYVVLIFSVFYLAWALAYYFFALDAEYYSSNRYRDPLIVSSSYLTMIIIYIVTLDKFFYKALLRHQALVTESGIFPSIAALKWTGHLFSKISFVKSKKWNAPSVADELSKWGKLKDQGLVSDEEFEEAKRKLMK
ncbi:MAG: SHOCT domain-containing protein [Emcibacteraceae bacterium]|nr:SHOCT domain-containing protein [Emcibacteraceae bacterium]